MYVVVDYNRDIYDYFEDMQALITESEWDALEIAFQHVCEQLAGFTNTRRISRLDFSSYQAALQSSLIEAVQHLVGLNVKALYFEYDLDNGWNSSFYLCQNYNSLDIGNDDWACDWTDEFRGPSFEAASEIYQPEFDKTKESKGTTLYLIARTVAAFGRCVCTVDFRVQAVCIAFHDQDPVMRIYDRE